MNFVDLIWFLILTSSLSTCRTLAVSPVNDYTIALRRELFDEKRFDPFNSPIADEGPKENFSSPLRIQIELNLIILHVQDLDEFTGSLTTNSWFLVHWFDYRLKWNPGDYGDEYGIYVPARSVWIPEFVLTNDVQAMIMRDNADGNVFVLYPGDVYWAAPVNFKTTCYIDHKLYPFDEHSCKISLRIWSMRVIYYELNIGYNNGEFESSILEHSGIENPLWEITSRKSEIKDLTFTCCPNFPLPIFETTITLRRRAPLFKYITITPGVLSTLLTLVLFWLPPTSNAKLGLGGTVMAIQTALLMYLGWRIPSGGNSIPAIVLFCGNTLVMAALSVVISVIIIRISKTSDSSIPNWIHFLTRDPCKSILCFGFAESQVWVRFIAKVGINNKDKDDVDLIESEGIDANHLPNPARAAPQSNWLLIGAAIDRLCFIIYCIVIGLIITISFL